MRKLSLIAALCLVPLVSTIAQAQGPGGPGGPPGGFGGFGGGRSLSKSADVDELVSKMMAFDANKDGSLTKDEVTDTRLLGLFSRADTNKDGTVTKAELTALGEKEYTAGGGGFGGGGPGGPGGPPGGPMGRPGELMPPMLQQILGLSSDQKSEMAALQKEVDAKIEKILNDRQNAMFKQMKERGPGGPGGGRGGRGGPGGPGN
jgi:hypothetical protein